MAFLVLTNAKVTINNVDLSDHVKSVTIKYSAEIHEDTAMGAVSKSRVAGLKDWSADIEFYQDYANSKIDATLFPLVGAPSFPISIIPVNATVSPTNPNYNGSAVLGDYSPVSGEVGALSMAPVTFQGDGDLARATS